MKTTRVKVVVADDHRVVREGLCALLKACPEFAVVGEAEDGEATLALVAQSCPDVVLLDYSMPVMDGAEVTRRISRQFPCVKVLIISCHVDVPHIQQALHAGATGYLTKFTAASELCDAVRAAARGETFLGPRARTVLKDSARHSFCLVNCSLTTRQEQVLKLIAEGQANKQIAAELAISIKTVEKHRQEVMNRLGIHNTAGLTRYAVESGLVGSMTVPA